MRPDQTRRLVSERTTLRSIVIALAALIVGCALLLVSESFDDFFADKHWLQSLMRDSGSLLMASVALASLWELYGKRSFAEELMAKVRLAEDVRSAGIIAFHESFNQGIEWNLLFKNAKSLDIFFIYGATWRNTHRAQLRAFAKRGGTKLRVFLPDPANAGIMNELANRISLTPEQVAQRIKEAETDFRSLAHSQRGASNRVELWYVSQAPQFTFYYFDHALVLAFNTHHRQRNIDPPAIVAEKGGALYRFIQNEISALISPEAGIARRVS